MSIGSDHLYSGWLLQRGDLLMHSDRNKVWNTGSTHHRRFGASA